MVPRRSSRGWFCGSRAAKFRSHLDECSLIDLGFKGAPFTYIRRQHGRISTHVRLDRALCNVEWSLLFPEASVHHLPRTCSDHNPILLKLHAPPPPAANRPFHFQAAWLTHPDFHAVVDKARSAKAHSVIEAVRATQGAVPDKCLW